MSMRHAAGIAVAALVSVPVMARAQSTQDQQQSQQQLPPVTVTAPQPGPAVPPVSPQVERYGMPQTIESTDRRKIEDTVNIVDTEDAIKYMPSLFVRKRNYGDTQPVLATRTWGVNSSARTLVYADDILLSALLGNNNTIGSPRWGLVSPEEIKGIDMLYGPFSAAYPGNSMGGVLLITTRMPDKFEATLKQTNAFQNFGYYKTVDTFTASNTAGTIGSKVGAFSFFLAANREESFSQPLGFVTSATFPAGVQGAIGALNKSGATANVLGASGLLHTIMDNYKLKWAVDLNDWLTFSHTIGYWQNNGYSTVQSYLTTANGTPTFAGQSGFASGNYRIEEQHLTNAVSLKSDTHGAWDFELVGMYYAYLTSTQRGPSGVGPGLNFSTAGTNARLDGTNWWAADAKGIWRPSGVGGPHEVSFGVHGDQYTLNNPTYSLSSWLTSPDSGTGLLTSFGAGKTQTWAFWIQDKWTFAPGWTATIGGRGETWRAFNGYNISGTTSVAQPSQQSTDFSPKASIAWQVNPEWNTKFNFGRAVRYPTVTELYQIVTTGLVNAVPNPNLLPESALSFEWSIERQDRNSRARVTLFEEDTSNALIQQTSLINGTPTNNFQNVGLVRNRGVEVVGELTDFVTKGLDLSASVTYVDSKIISNPNFRSTTGTTSEGMWAPYVPQWRGNAVAVYRPTDKWSLSAAARWQGLMYSTLDNSDYIHGAYQSFDPFVVVDLKARYKFMEHAAFEFGVDNVNDYKYFEFHPFPGRTFVASLKATF
jgi:iron complex outermembrane receptor protein